MEKHSNGLSRNTIRTLNPAVLLALTIFLFSCDAGRVSSRNEIQSDGRIDSVYFYGAGIEDSVKVREGNYPVLIFINNHYRCSGVVAVKRINNVLRPVVSGLQLMLLGVVPAVKMPGTATEDISRYYTGAQFTVSKRLISAYFIFPADAIEKERNCLGSYYSLNEEDSFLM